jgi:hypothetical protein
MHLRFGGLTSNSFYQCLSETTPSSLLFGTIERGL